MAFSIFTEFCNITINQFYNIFITPKINLSPLAATAPALNIWIRLIRGRALAWVFVKSGPGESLRSSS